jgi:hypothetical protein
MGSEGFLVHIEPQGLVGIPLEYELGDGLVALALVVVLGPHLQLSDVLMARRQTPALGALLGVSQRVVGDHSSQEVRCQPWQNSHS